MSLAKFQEISGIDRGDLCKIENGQVNITLPTLEKIATALEIPTVALFNEGPLLNK